MLFTLLPSQVNELEAVEDVRDLDIMLNKILEQAEDMPLYSMDESEYSYTHKGMGFIALIADIFKDLIQLVRISEVRIPIYEQHTNTVLINKLKHAILGEIPANFFLSHCYRMFYSQTISDSCYSHYTRKHFHYWLPAHLYRVQ